VRATVLTLFLFFLSTNSHTHTYKNRIKHIFWGFNKSGINF
jgi:hypothetical protein